MTQRCYWFKCKKCNHVWWAHLAKPFFQVSLSLVTLKCVKCKTLTSAYADEPSWYD